jgi:hypothetical protein
MARPVRCRLALLAASGLVAGCGSVGGPIAGDDALDACFDALAGAARTTGVSLGSNDTSFVESLMAHCLEGLDGGLRMQCGEWEDGDTHCSSGSGDEPSAGVNLSRAVRERFD